MGVFSVESLKGLNHIQVAYRGKDNPIEVLLKEDEKEYDFSGAHAIRCKIGEVLIDSATEPEAFDRTEAQIGKLKIFIGDQIIAPQAYNVKVEIDDAEKRTLYFGHVRVKIEDPGI